MTSEEIRERGTEVGTELQNCPDADWVHARTEAFKAEIIVEIAAQLAEANESRPTLRDQLAMAAIAGNWDDHLPNDNNKMATWAYKMADAMLAARAKEAANG